MCSRLSARQRNSVAGAMGVALAAEQTVGAAADFQRSVRLDAALLAAARPTAVNLAVGVQHALAAVGDAWENPTVARLRLTAAVEQFHAAEVWCCSRRVRTVPDCLERVRGSAQSVTRVLWRPHRVRHGVGCGAAIAGGWSGAVCLGAGDATTAAGCASDRVGTRARRHRARGATGCCGCEPFRSWSDRCGCGWCGSHCKKWGYRE